MNRMQFVTSLSFLVFSEIALAATTSLEKRFQDELCLGRWTVLQTAMVHTSSVLHGSRQEDYFVDEDRVIDPVHIHGPRESSVAGAFRRYMDLCNEHGAGILRLNSNYHSIHMKTDANVVESRRKFTYRGFCSGTYIEKVKKTRLVAQDFPLEGSTSSKIEKTAHTSIGLTKTDVANNPDLIVGSLSKTPSTVTSKSLTDAGEIEKTVTTKDISSSFGTCSTADHIPAEDLQSKAKYLMGEIANWEKDNYASCAHPEFKAIAGTLWHIRMLDLSRQILPVELRKKLDEKALLYPSCVLEGDQLPNFEVPPDDDFSISNTAYEWIPNQSVDISIQVLGADSMSIFPHNEPGVFDFMIISTSRRINFGFSFYANGSFRETMRANISEFTPGTPAYSERLSALIAELDGYAEQIREFGPSTGLEPLLAFQAHLKKLLGS